MKTIVLLECSDCGKQTQFDMSIEDICHPSHGDAHLRNAATDNEFCYFDESTSEMCFDCMKARNLEVPFVVAKLNNVRLAYTLYSPAYGVFHLEVMRDGRWYHVSGSAMSALPEYCQRYGHVGILRIFQDTLTHMTTDYRGVRIQKWTRQQQKDHTFMEREAFAIMHYDLMRRMQEK